MKREKKENHISLRLGQDQLEVLVNRAYADDRSVSAIIRIAINEYIERTTQKSIQKAQILPNQS